MVLAVDNSTVPDATNGAVYKGLAFGTKVTTPLWAADRVRHLRLVAPSMRSSNTGGATPSGSKASHARLSVTARRSDGPMEPKTQPMEEDQCHSTEA